MDVANITAVAVAEVSAATLSGSLFFSASAAAAMDSLAADAAVDVADAAKLNHFS